MLVIHTGDSVFIEVLSTDRGEQKEASIASETESARFAG